MRGINHLLVIRLSAMGDVAMTVPVLLALAQKYPQLRVTILTKTFFAPIFSNLPNVKVCTVDVKDKHKGFFGLFTLFRELWALRVDAVADLHQVLRSKLLAGFFRLSGVKVKAIDKGRAEKKALVRGKSVFKPLKTTHTRYAEVFGALGLKFELSKHNTKPKEPLPSQFKELLSRRPEQIIGIAPFAAHVGKTYPASLMETVVSSLAATGKYTIVLFGGGKAENDVFDVWEKKYANTFNIIGLGTFEEELALISNLGSMVAMDSGNAHLAAMYGIPTITLWGVTHPYTGFAPFEQGIENCLLSDRSRFPKIPTSVYGNKVPLGYAEVMQTISPTQVLERIDQLLGQ